MENAKNITQIIIETINTILQNLFSSIDNNLYEITVENHEPIIHNKITNYESILDALEIKFHKGGPK